MELRYHQSGETQAEWDAGSEVWDDRLGWGAVCVNGEWLLDAHGNRRRFKTKAGADRAAKKRIPQQALEFIASQENYTFAECSLAEEIIGRAKAALER